MKTGDLDARISAIEARNQRVEHDKAWEGSLTRRALIIVFTYLSIGIYMWTIGINSPWLNALVPAIGFTLSTLTLPLFKQWWLKCCKLN